MFRYYSDYNLPQHNLYDGPHNSRPASSSPWMNDIGQTISSLRRSRQEMDSMSESINRLPVSRPVTPVYRPSTPAEGIYVPLTQDLAEPSYGHSYTPVNHAGEKLVEDFQYLLSQQLDDARTENERLRYNNDELQKRLKSKDDELDGIRPRFHEVQANLEGASVYIDRLAETVDHIQNENCELQVTCEVQSTEAMGLQKLVGVVEDEKRRKELEIQEVTWELEGAKKEKEHMELENNELTEEAEELKSINAVLRNECQELVDNLAKVHKENDRLRNQLRDSRLVVGDLRAEMDHLVVERDDLLQEQSPIKKILPLGEEKLDGHDSDALATPSANSVEENALERTLEVENGGKKEYELEQSQAENLQLAELKSRAEHECVVLREAYDSLQREMRAIKEALKAYQEEQKKEAEIMEKSNQRLKNELKRARQGDSDQTSTVTGNYPGPIKVSCLGEEVAGEVSEYDEMESVQDAPVYDDIFENEAAAKAARNHHGAPRGHSATLPPIPVHGSSGSATEVYSEGDYLPRGSAVEATIRDINLAGDASVNGLSTNETLHDTIRGSPEITHLEAAIVQLDRDNAQLREKCRQMEEAVNQPKDTISMDDDFSDSSSPQGVRVLGTELPHIRTQLFECRELLRKQEDLITLLARRLPYGMVPNMVSGAGTEAWAANSSTDVLVAEVAGNGRIDDLATSAAIEDLQKGILELRQSIEGRETVIGQLTDRTDSVLNDSERKELAIKALTDDISSLLSRKDSETRHAEEMEQNFKNLSGSWDDWSREIQGHVSREFSSRDDRLRSLEERLGELLTALEALRSIRVDEMSSTVPGGHEEDHSGHHRPRNMSGDINTFQDGLHADVKSDEFHIRSPGLEEQKWKDNSPKEHQITQTVVDSVDDFEAQTQWPIITNSENSYTGDLQPSHMGVLHLPLDSSLTVDVSEASEGHPLDSGYQTSKRASGRNDKDTARDLEKLDLQLSMDDNFHSVQSPRSNKSYSEDFEKDVSESIIAQKGRSLRQESQILDKPSSKVVPGGDRSEDTSFHVPLSMDESFHSGPFVQSPRSNKSYSEDFEKDVSESITAQKGRSLRQESKILDQPSSKDVPGGDRSEDTGFQVPTLDERDYHNAKELSEQIGEKIQSEVLSEIMPDTKHQGGAVSADTFGEKKLKHEAVIGGSTESFDELIKPSESMKERAALSEIECDQKEESRNDAPLEDVESDEDLMKEKMPKMFENGVNLDEKENACDNADDLYSDDFSDAASVDSDKFEISRSGDRSALFHTSGKGLECTTDGNVDYQEQHLNDRLDDCISGDIAYKSLSQMKPIEASEDVAYHSHPSSIMLESGIKSPVDLISEDLLSNSGSDDTLTDIHESVPSSEAFDIDILGNLKGASAVDHKPTETSTDRVPGVLEDGSSRGRPPRPGALDLEEMSGHETRHSGRADVSSSPRKILPQSPTRSKIPVLVGGTHGGSPLSKRRSGDSNEGEGIRSPPFVPCNSPTLRQYRNTRTEEDAEVEDNTDSCFPSIYKKQSDDTYESQEESDRNDVQVDISNKKEASTKTDFVDLHYSSEKLVPEIHILETKDAGAQVEIDFASGKLIRRFMGLTSVGMSDSPSDESSPQSDIDTVEQRGLRVAHGSKRAEETNRPLQIRQTLIPPARVKLTRSLSDSGLLLEGALANPGFKGQMFEAYKDDPDGQADTMEAPPIPPERKHRQRSLRSSLEMEDGDSQGDEERMYTADELALLGLSPVSMHVTLADPMFQDDDNVIYRRGRNVDGHQLTIHRLSEVDEEDVSSGSSQPSPYPQDTLSSDYEETLNAILNQGDHSSPAFPAGIRLGTVGSLDVSSRDGNVKKQVHEGLGEESNEDTLSTSSVDRTPEIARRRFTDELSTLDEFNYMNGEGFGQRHAQFRGGDSSRMTSSKSASLESQMLMLAGITTPLNSQLPDGNLASEDTDVLVNQEGKLFNEFSEPQLDGTLLQGQIESLELATSEGITDKSSGRQHPSINEGERFTFHDDEEIVCATNSGKQNVDPAAHDIEGRAGVTSWSKKDSDRIRVDSSELYLDSAGTTDDGLKSVKGADKQDILRLDVESNANKDGMDLKKALHDAPRPISTEIHLTRADEHIHGGLQPEQLDRSLFSPTQELSMSFSDDDFDDSHRTKSLLQSRQGLEKGPLLAFDLESSYETLYDPGVTPRSHPALAGDEDPASLGDSHSSATSTNTSTAGDARPPSLPDEHMGSAESPEDWDTSRSTTPICSEKDFVLDTSGERFHMPANVDLLPPIKPITGEQGRSTADSGVSMASGRSTETPSKRAELDTVLSSTHLNMGYQFIHKSEETTED